MKYSRVYLDTIGYELAPVVVSSAELEDRLAPLYKKLHMPHGQLENLTGIEERRWWEAGAALSDGAIASARKALALSQVTPADIGAVFYTGVGRDYFEPATACRVAADLGLGPETVVHDLSNACLGMLSGMLDMANRIELGQIRAGLVVCAESAREIVEETITRMLETPTMEFYIGALATLTGGSGAAAMLITDGSFGGGHKVLGGVVRAAAEHHDLCRWGLEQEGPRLFREWLKTDAPAVLKYGVELGVRTWQDFLGELGWRREDVDRTLSHQVGAANRDAIMKEIGLSPAIDFPTFPFLGNVGTASLPLTAAIATERNFVTPGQRVAFLGIGSGLNCMMLGLEW